MIILPRRIIIRSYARNIIMIARGHDWTGNFPGWTVLLAQCIGMVLFVAAVRHVWNELQSYESMRKQGDLLEVRRLRSVQLVLAASRKNPSFPPVSKHKRHRRSAGIIRQINSVNTDGLDDNVIDAAPAPGSLDTDSDGLYDVEEKALGTDWRRKDTDGDGLNDDVELKMGLDPLSYDSMINNVDCNKLDGNGDGSIQFGTFSHPSSGSRQKWNSPPHIPKRGRKQP